MLMLPAADASDDEWFEFAQARSEDLLPHLREFILERFTYKPRYVQQKVWRSFATVSARSKRFDLYFRLFGRPDANCPRETLVIARIHNLGSGWSVGGGVNARGPIASGTDSRPLNAPGQARLDAMIKYDSKTWTANLGVKNINNKRLYDDIISGISTRVQPERTYTLTTTFKF